MCLRRLRKKSKLCQRFLYFVRRFINYQRKRAECVIFKKTTDEEIQILLREPDINQCIKKQYKIPGGGIELNETPEISCEREAKEEVGALGKVCEYLLDYYDEYKGLYTKIFMMCEFNMLNEEEYEEGKLGRGRKWFNVNEALKFLPEIQKQAVQQALLKLQQKQYLK